MKNKPTDEPIDGKFTDKSINGHLPLVMNFPKTEYYSEKPKSINLFWKNKTHMTTQLSRIKPNIPLSKMIPKL